jgi:hypothetical protein
LNGAGFTWPLFLFAGAMPESLMAKMGKIHAGRPIRIKSRRELLETIKPHHRAHLRPDTGDIDEEIQPKKPGGPRFIGLVSPASAGATQASPAGSI